MEVYWDDGLFVTKPLTEDLKRVSPAIASKAYKRHHGLKLMVDWYESQTGGKGILPWLHELLQVC